MPIPTPPPTATASTKSSAMRPGVTVLTIARSEAFSATSAVASLRRLSPSSTVSMRRGRRSRPAIAVTATASVGATIAPNARAAATVIAGTTIQATAPTTATVKTTSPTDSRRMLSPRARTSRTEVRIAAA